MHDFIVLKWLKNGIVIIFSAFSSYGRVDFCYEMKGYTQTSVLK